MKNFKNKYIIIHSSFEEIAIYMIYSNSMLDSESVNSNNYERNKK